MTNLPADVAFLASLPAAIDLENGRDASGSRSFRPADVVLAIRRDLKLAVKAGLIPKHAKFSVTREDYKSIYVNLTGWQGQVLVTGYIEVCMEAYVAGKEPSVEAVDPFMSRLGWEATRREGMDGRLIDAINDVMWLVERIAGRHNYDNSDSMVDHFDKGYYLDVSARGLISTAEHGLRLECNPVAQERLRAAHAAAKRVGLKVVKSICGKRGVDGCGDWAMDKLLELDAKANGRPLVYDKRWHRWMVDTNKPVADSAEMAMAASGE